MRDFLIWLIDGEEDNWWVVYVDGKVPPKAFFSYAFENELDSDWFFEGCFNFIISLLEFVVFGAIIIGVSYWFNLKGDW